MKLGGATIEITIMVDTAALRTEYEKEGQPFGETDKGLAWWYTLRLRGKVNAALNGKSDILADLRVTEFKE